MLTVSRSIYTTITAFDPNSFHSAKLLEKGSNETVIKRVSAYIFFIICGGVAWLLNEV
jgi:hypothetical protein